jgi:TPR repeat protein
VSLPVCIADAFVGYYPWSNFPLPTSSPVAVAPSSPSAQAVATGGSRHVFRASRKTTPTASSTPTVRSSSTSEPLQSLDYYLKLSQREPKNTKVMVNIGYIYHHGLFGTPADKIKASEWYRRAAWAKDELACYNVGWLYFDGAAASRDWHQCQFWWHRSRFVGRQRTCSLCYSNKSSNSVVNEEKQDSTATPASVVCKHADEEPDYKENYQSNLLWQFRDDFHAHCERILKQYISAVDICTDNPTLCWYMYIIGRLYCHGIGTSMDTPTALNWWQRGTRISPNNNGSCHLALSIAYGSPTPCGLPYDHDIAVGYANEAVGYGNMLGHHRLANLYYRDGPHCDYKISFDHSMKAAESGILESQYQLGKKFMAGRGRGTDFGAAMKWLEMAFASGHAEAADEIGGIYERDSTAASNDDDDDKNKNDMTIDDIKVDYHKAARYFVEAGKRGSFSGSYNAGWCYTDTDKYGIIADPVRAYHWMMIAKDRPIDDSKSKLGPLTTWLTYARWSLKGYGCAVSVTRALRYFHKIVNAVDEGLKDPVRSKLFVTPDMVDRSIPKTSSSPLVISSAGDAENHLGDIYMDGYDVVTVDEKKACMHPPTPPTSFPCYFDNNMMALLWGIVNWYLRSAKHRDAEGAYNVYQCYESGRGVQVDEKEALKWLLVAAELDKRYKLALGIFINYARLF